MYYSEFRTSEPESGFRNTVIQNSVIRNSVIRNSGGIPYLSIVSTYNCYSYVFFDLKIFNLDPIIYNFNLFYLGNHDFTFFSRWHI